MYRIPLDLDLSPVVGQFTTQICVGQFDLQFTFGAIRFAVQSIVTLVRDGKVVASWEEGRWPSDEFFHVMNTNVTRCAVASDRLIVFEFANGLEMHLEDSFDQYESMHIYFPGREWPIIV